VNQQEFDEAMEEMKKGFEAMWSAIGKAFTSMWDAATEEAQEKVTNIKKKTKK
jgi:hypothetical protein